MSAFTGACVLKKAIFSSGEVHQLSGRLELSQVQDEIHSSSTALNAMRESRIKSRLE
jgi:hypothetical protein